MYMYCMCRNIHTQTSGKTSSGLQLSCFCDPASLADENGFVWFFAVILIKVWSYSSISKASPASRPHIWTGAVPALYQLAFVLSFQVKTLLRRLMSLRYTTLAVIKCASPGSQHPVHIWAEMQIRSESVTGHKKRSLSLHQSNLINIPCVGFTRLLLICDLLYR